MFQTFPALSPPPPLKPLAQNSLILAFWVTSYLAIDVIKWTGGRSTLVSNIAISLPMIASAFLLTVMIDQLCVRLKDGQPALVFPLLGLSVSLAAIVQCLLDQAVVQIAASTLFPDWTRFIPADGEWRLGFGVYIYTVEFLLCVFILALFRARRSIRRVSAREIETASAHRLAEAKALRLQLNPHFLFNALNSIAALVAKEGNRNADAMICRLSDFLRASITVDPLADVSLASELATIDAYLAIEQLRFGARLSVEFEVAPNAWHARIPNFILQPLFENAIKHGLIDTKSAIKVRLEVRRKHDLLHMAVINHHVAGTPSPTPVRTRHFGVGLANTRQRLTLFGGDQAKLQTEILADGFRATLQLPFRSAATLNPNNTLPPSPAAAAALEASS
jgi:two-component system LytT family sensor kinase